MRDSTRKMIVLMEQENGVTEFQYASIIDGEWRDCNTPTAPQWGSPNTFRVKPKKPVEGWTWKYLSGGLGALYEHKQPDDPLSEGRIMILMREVTE